MASFGRYWLRWPSLEAFMGLPWAWPLCETVHFIGLCLLVGIVGMFDLRVLGVAKGLPFSELKRLLPWGVFGFVLCLPTGALFIGGMEANIIGENPYDVIARDGWIQAKLIFIFLAGVNLLIFYVSGMAHALDRLGPQDDAPRL